nr:MFS transporter [Chloroflexia bacterium]
MRRSEMLVAVYLPTVLLAFSQGLLLATLPLYADGFGVGYQLVSLAVGAAALGTLLTDVPAGALLARIGLRPAMVGGSGLVAASTLALALTDTFPTVIVARLLAGVGTALWALSRHAFLTETVPPGQRGQALSVFGGINRIGVFAGPALGGVVADRLGLDASFILSAALAGLALAVSVVLIEAAPRVVVAPRGVRWGLVAAAVKASGRDLGAAALAQTLAQMIRAGRYLIIPLYGADRLGLDPGRIGLVMTVGALVDVSMFVPAGWLMDRFGRKTASVPSFAVMAVGVGLIPLARDFNGLLLASVVIGLGNGLGSGAMMTLGADLAPPGATGEFLGVWRLIGDLGAVLGPITVGWVAVAFGLVGGAWALAGVGVAASLTLALLVRETRAGPLREGG